MFKCALSFVCLLLPTVAVAQMSPVDNFRLESVTSTSDQSGTHTVIDPVTRVNQGAAYRSQPLLYPTLRLQRTCTFGQEWTMTTLLSDCQPTKRRLRTALKFVYTF
jgi:hypothetical protein